MSKNLIPKIAEMLGVELGEEFKIKDNTGTLDSVALNSVYAFIEHDSLEGPTLTLSTGEARPLYMPPRPLEPIALKVFELLCRGKCEVVKLPWKPKKGEQYYTFVPRSNDEKLIVTSALWENDVADNALLKAGWVFKTEEKAQKALPIVAKEIGAKYELPNTKIVEPWKPKFADRYFGFFEFYGKLRICRYDIWSGTVGEEAQYRCGWIFHTKAEAEAALPKVAAEMGVDYAI